MRWLGKFEADAEILPNADHKQPFPLLWNTVIGNIQNSIFYMVTLHSRKLLNKITGKRLRNEPFHVLHQECFGFQLKHNVEKSGKSREKRMILTAPSGVRDRKGLTGWPSNHNIEVSLRFPLQNILHHCLATEAVQVQVVCFNRPLIDVKASYPSSECAKAKPRLSPPIPQYRSRTLTMFLPPLKLLRVTAFI